VFKKILIICVGNICRSPTAEYLLRHHLSDTGILVESAGLSVLVGRPMDATAKEVLQQHGVSAGDHRARQVSTTMLRSVDLVLAMERDHVTQLMRLAPEASGKVMLLDRWRRGEDVPDPYRQDREAFEHVFGMIDEGVRGWVYHLRGF